MSTILNKKLLDNCIEITDEAGAAIMEIYKSCNFQTEYKEDNSPLTKADLASHDIIVKRLRALTPNVSVISEEGEEKGANDDPSLFWLVDPLDGTKEFIKRNGEFTVNIALIDRGLPVLGIVYAPAQDTMYVGGKGFPARKRNTDYRWQEIKVVPVPSGEGKVRIVSSCSHGSDLLDVWIKDHFDEDFVELCGVGSSLKLCMVAEGAAHFYPRFGRTMEWDIAAGHAVLTAAAGYITVFDKSKMAHLQPLTYGKEGHDNPHFVASYTPL